MLARPEPSAPNNQKNPDVIVINKTDLHFYQLTGEHQPHAGYIPLPLVDTDPQPAHLLYIGAHPQLLYTLRRLASAVPQHFDERIDIPHWIIVPVTHPRAGQFELEGQEGSEDVCLCGGWLDGRQCGEEGRGFR